jgi:hypothetical protein
LRLEANHARTERRSGPAGSGSDFLQSHLRQAAPPRAFPLQASNGHSRHSKHQKRFHPTGSTNPTYATQEKAASTQRRHSRSRGQAARGISWRTRAAARAAAAALRDCLEAVSV